MVCQMGQSPLCIQPSYLYAVIIKRSPRYAQDNPRYAISCPRRRHDYASREKRGSRFPGNREGGTAVRNRISEPHSSKLVSHLFAMNAFGFTGTLQKPESDQAFGINYPSEVIFPGGIHQEESALENPRWPRRGRLPSRDLIFCNSARNGSGAAV